MRKVGVALGLVAALALAAPAGAQILALPLSGAMPTYDVNGVLQTPSHVVAWSCTLALGTCTVTLANAAAFTSASTYYCWGSDQALAATLASVSNVSGTSFKVYGTLTDTVRGGCVGW